MYLILFPSNTVQKKGTDSILVGLFSILRAATLPEGGKKKVTQAWCWLQIHQIEPSLTLSLRHLPVTHIDPLITSYGQREGSNISRTENICYVGPHELKKDVSRTLVPISNMHSIVKHSSDGQFVSPCLQLLLSWNLFQLHFLLGSQNWGSHLKHTQTSANKVIS